MRKTYAFLFAFAVFFGFVWVSNAQFGNPGSQGTTYDGTGVAALVCETLEATTSVETPYLTDGSAEIADDGFIRLPNNKVALACETATPGTDMSITCNSSNQFSISSPVHMNAQAVIGIDELRANSTGGILDLTGADGCFDLENAAGSLNIRMCVISGSLRVSGNINTLSDGSYAVTDASGNTRSLLAATSVSGNSGTCFRLFSSTTIVAGSYDILLCRDAAGRISLSDGTVTTMLDINDDDTLKCKNSDNTDGCYFQAKSHDFDATTFASLGTPSDGRVMYCSDCTKATPCAGAGNGAIAKRLNGAWDCD